MASAKALSAAVKALFREDPAYPLNIDNGTNVCPRCPCAPVKFMWHSKAEALAILECPCQCHEALRFGYRGVVA